MGKTHIYFLNIVLSVINGKYEHYYSNHMTVTVTSPDR